MFDLYACEYVRVLLPGFFVCMYVCASRARVATQKRRPLKEKSTMIYAQEIDYKKERDKNKENNEQETRYHSISYNNYIMYVWAWSTSQSLFRLCTNSM